MNYSVWRLILNLDHLSKTGFGFASLTLIALNFFSSVLPSVAVPTTVGQVLTNPDRNADAIQLFILGEDQLQKRQYQEALKTFERILPIFRANLERAGEVATLRNIGLAYHYLEQYENALDFYQQSLVIGREINNRSDLVKTLQNIAFVLTSLNRVSQALEYQQQALELYRELGDRTKEIDILIQIGKGYYSIGNYDRALLFYDQALAAIGTVGERFKASIVLNNLGLVYRELGQYEKALQKYEESLAIGREIENPSSQGTALNNLASLYNTMGQYEKALEFYQQSLTLIRAVGDPKREGATLSNIGSVYKNLQQYPQALEFYEKSLAIVKKIGDRTAEGSILNNLGNIYSDLKQPEKALKLYEQSLALVREVGNRLGEGRTLYGMGILYSQLSQYAKAEEKLFASINVLETLRDGLTDADKVSIFETQVSTYEFLQKVLIAQNKIETALEISERGRARAFVELLATRISEKSPAQIPIQSPNFQQIQQVAREQNATLVTYSIIANEALYIWVIQPTGELTFRSVDITPLNVAIQQFTERSRVAAATGRGVLSDTTIAEVVRGTREAIAATNPSPESPVTPDRSPLTCRGKGCLRQMYQLSIEPIADLLPKNPQSRIIFIPHQSLFLVPFAALRDANGRYLIEQYTFLTAPSIQVLQLTREQSKKNQQSKPSGVVVVGNPIMPTLGNPPKQLEKLPGSEQEAIAIAQLLQTQPILGPQATKSWVTQQMQQSRIVHLATHGLLNELGQREVPGAIALTPSGNDNGLLTSNEILDLKLKAELVVLSACNTGRGRITGDGVVGLSRSLLGAGASSVVVSLWLVPDNPTSLLMTEFYRQMQQNPDKAQALRQAMLKTMQQYPDPSQWAAFTLIGEALN